MTLPREYRGWTVDFDMKPIPYRGADWTATHPDYDASYEGPEDGWVGSHPVLTAATEKELWAEIDEWELDREESLRTFEVCFGDPRKSMQSVYVVRAETEAEAIADAKRTAKAERIPQAFHAVYEVRT